MNVLTDTIYIRRIFIKPFLWPFFKTAKAGAQTSIFAAIDPDLNDVTGKYFSDCKEKEVAEAGQDDKMAAWLWAVSAKWSGLEESEARSAADKVK